VCVERGIEKTYVGEKSGWPNGEDDIPCRFLSVCVCTKTKNFYVVCLYVCMCLCVSVWIDLEEIRADEKSGWPRGEIDIP
jgi:hypothetical protein